MIMQLVSCNIKNIEMNTMDNKEEHYDNVAETYDDEIVEQEETEDDDEDNDLQV